MTILVIDGHGGNTGTALVREITQKMPDAELIAVGPNSIATASMLKAGARNAATGENAVLVACRRADVIAGPVGIVIADALLGEVTPAMAVAVGQSRAARVLIPVNRCDTLVAGVTDNTTASLLQDAVAKIIALTHPV